MTRTDSTSQSAMHPTLQIIQAQAVAPQPWRNGGGQTRELLTWPATADWLLRISRADIASDGPFSAFAGVRRWFVVLEGAGVDLQFADGKRRVCQGDAPLQFDGAAAPGCQQIDGPTQDLNLMVRGGLGTLVPVTPGVPWTASHPVRGLYTKSAGRLHHAKANGIGNNNDNNDHRTISLPLPAHSLVWMESSADESWCFHLDAADPAATDAERQGLRAASTDAWYWGYTPAVPRL